MESKRPPALVGNSIGKLAYLAHHRYTTAAFVLLMHLLALTVFFIQPSESSGRDWAVFFGLFVLSNFAVSGGFHRHFAHKAYRTSRWFRFLLGLLGGIYFGDVVGFTGRHRLHHKYSDTELDAHSPRRGWWYCWVGHLLDGGYTEAEILAAARDLTKYPEIMWLHRYFFVPGLLAIAVSYAVGGFSLLVTGYFLNFVVAFHGPSAINYFCHKGRNRRYETGDHSTNNALLGLVLFGEGWHNNHHHSPGSVNFGFRWYEVDLMYYLLKVLSWCGLVWDLREPDSEVKTSGLIAS